MRRTKNNGFFVLKFHQCITIIYYEIQLNIFERTYTNYFSGILILNWRIRVQIRHVDELLVKMYN